MANQLKLRPQIKLLIIKNSSSFWKTWKSKISKPACLKPCIENVSSDQDAADKFATFFKETCSPNSTEFNSSKSKVFLERLAHYSGHSFSTTKWNIKAEIVSLSMSKLDVGKSPGCDGLTTEHLINCHPVIFTMLAKLFNMFIMFSYVPPDFGRGITIPIPKDENSRGAHPISSFRGITLSPVLSKVFEHCVLLVFSKYLVTSEKQFGFKAHVGCTHAIYTLHNVVDYIALRDSTLNACFLDISEAFDMINQL
jgi:hypothetical protein